MWGRLAESVSSTRRSPKSKRARVCPRREAADPGQAHGAEPLRHHVDPRLREPQQLDEIAAGGVGDRDHPRGATCGERHEHAHTAVAQAGVGIGEAGVDQVVDCEHPPEAPVRGRGGGE